MAMSEFSKSALLVGGVFAGLGGVLWWTMGGTRREDRLSQRISRRARGLESPWQGTDYLERRVSTHRNRLLNILFKGPNANSPQYVEQAAAFVADLDSQNAPRGYAKRRQEQWARDLKLVISQARARMKKDGFGGLGAPPEVHLKKAEEMVARASRQLDNAMDAKGCKARVDIALEAHMLASIGAAEAGAQNIERSKMGARRSADEAHADRLFTASMSTREFARELIKACTR